MMVLRSIFRNIWLVSIHSICALERIKRALRAAMRTEVLTLSCPEGEAGTPAPRWTGLRCRPLSCGSRCLLFTRRGTCWNFSSSFFLKEPLNLRHASASPERNDLPQQLEDDGQRAELLCMCLLEGKRTRKMTYHNKR